MASGSTAEMEFMADVEERKPGFFKQVKQFFKDTDGGAVPVSLACKATGLSKARIHQLILEEKDAPGTGLRAWKFNGTVLVSAKDIDRIASAPKPKRGRPKKS